MEDVRYRYVFTEHMSATYQLDVAWLLELALDERAHLGVLFPSEQRRSGSKSQLQIGSARLP